MNTAQVLVELLKEYGNEPIFIDVPTKSELEELPPVHAWQEALLRESIFGSFKDIRHRTADQGQ